MSNEKVIEMEYTFLLKNANIEKIKSNNINMKIGLFAVTLILCVSFSVQGDDDDYDETPSTSPEFFYPESENFMCPSEITDVFTDEIGNHKYHFSAKTGTHPNSSVYDDVIDEERYDINGTLDVISQTSTDKYTNATAFVANLVLNWGSAFTYVTEDFSLLTPRVTVSVFSFDSVVMDDILAQFGIDFVRPFVTGVYVDYSWRNDRVHVFGTALGLSFDFIGNDTIGVHPRLKIAMFDTYLSKCVRNIPDGDGDIICVDKKFTTGMIFDNIGSSGVIVKDLEHYVGETIDPVTEHRHKKENTTNTERVALVNIAHSPYTNQRFILGDGNDDLGLLGTPNGFYTGYGVSDVEIHGNNKRGLSSRLRFVFFTCHTSCPHNATHYFNDHPDLQQALFNVVPPQKSRHITFVPVHDFTSDLYAATPTSILYANDHLQGGLGLYIDAIQVGESLYTSIIAALTFDSVRITETMDSIGPLAQHYVENQIKVTKKDFGVYGNFMRSPYHVSTWSAVTGVSFFEDVFNLTGDYGRYFPTSLVFSFGNPSSNMMMKGQRIPDTTAQVAWLGLGSQASFKFGANGIQNNTGNMPRTLIELGFIDDDDFILLENNDETPDTDDFIIYGIMQAVSFQGQHNAANATFLTVVKPCSNPVADDYIIEDISVNENQTPVVIMVVSISVLLVAMLTFFLVQQRK